MTAHLGQLKPESTHHALALHLLHAPVHQLPLQLWRILDDQIC